MIDLGKKSKKVQWTIKGVSDTTREQAMQAAKQQKISVSELVEQLINEDRQNARQKKNILGLNDLQDAARFMAKLDKRLQTLEKKLTSDQSNNLH